MTEPIKNGYHTTVTTKNGTYHVGMTRAQAQKNNNYNKIFGRDFSDIDFDNNGILSQEEILTERVDKEMQNDLYSKFMATILPLVTLGTITPNNALSHFENDKVKQAKEELNRYYSDENAQKEDASRKPKPATLKFEA